MPNSCTIEDCGNRAFGHGFCNKHYKRWRKYGDPLGTPPPRPSRLCDVPDCGREHYGHGLCSAHHQQKRAGKDITTPRRRNVTAECLRPACSKLGTSAEYCQRHYNRAYKIARCSDASIQFIWDQVDALFDSQQGQCAICTKDLDLEAAETHLDHCHKTGRLRGVLCQHCNQGLGQFGDDANLLRKAAEYL
jgi:hypothetical protein